MDAAIFAHLTALKSRKHVLTLRMTDDYRKVVESQANSLKEVIKIMLQQHSGN